MSNQGRYVKPRSGTFWEKPQPWHMEWTTQAGRAQGIAGITWSCHRPHWESHSTSTRSPGVRLRHLPQGSTHLLKTTRDILLDMGRDRMPEHGSPHDHESRTAQYELDPVNSPSYKVGWAQQQTILRWKAEYLGSSTNMAVAQIPRGAHHGCTSMPLELTPMSVRDPLWLAGRGRKSLRLIYGGAGS